MGKLSGKVALITGGNSGMGLATAQLFAKEGAKVVITGRRQKELDSAIKSIDGVALGVQGDVSNLSDLDKLFQTIKDKFGHLDIIFANAGLGEMAPIGQVSEEVYDRQFNVNVKGLFFTVQKALPLLRDGSAIVLNSSITGYKGLEAFSVYSATKAAVRSFARSWANDLRARRIRVNAISPGPIETPIFDKMGLSKEQAIGFKESVKEKVLLGRMGTGNEIAKSVLFLVSDDSSYIDGVNLSIDGGFAQV